MRERKSSRRKATKKPTAPQVLSNPLYAQFLDFKPRKRDVRRAIIVEAAIDCIATLGVENTSFEAIGKKAGMLKAHVAYYFPNRDDLIEEVIKFSVSSVQAMSVEGMKAETDPEQKLAAFITATFRWRDQFPKQSSVILLLYYYASFRRPYQKIHDRIRSLGAERIRAALSLQAAFRGAPQAFLHDTSKLIQSILTGNLIDFITTTPQLQLEEVRDKTLGQVEALIYERK